MDSIPYQLQCDGKAVPILVTAYVKKSKRLGTPTPSKEKREDKCLVPELVLSPYNSTTIKKNQSIALRTQTELQKQNQLQSIREKLGKSKKFHNRDKEVLRLMKEPQLISKFVHIICNKSHDSHT